MGSPRATTPWAAPDWRSAGAVAALGKDLAREVKADKITTFAAAFAYHTVFAMPAFLLLTVGVAALLDRAAGLELAEPLRDFVRGHAPAKTKELLGSIVDDAIAKVGGGASLGVLSSAVVALWSGSNAIGALIEAFNRAYDVDEGRSLVKRRLIAVGLTVLLALSVNVAFCLLVFGGRIGHWIAEQGGFGGAFDVLWAVLRWPVAIAAIAAILAVLYHAGPNVKQSFRWVSPGSVLATALWLVATLGFGVYLRISNPGGAYGVVGGLLVLLLFLFITGIVFLLGAELNALLASRYDREMIEDLANHPHAEPEARADARRRLRQMT